MDPKFKPKQFTYAEMESIAKCDAEDVIIAVLGRDCWEVLQYEGEETVKIFAHDIVLRVMENYGTVPAPDLQKTMIVNLLRQIPKRNEVPYQALGSEEYRLLVKLNLPSDYRAGLFADMSFPRHLHQDYIFMIRNKP